MVDGLYIGSEGYVLLLPESDVGGWFLQLDSFLTGDFEKHKDLFWPLEERDFKDNKLVLDLKLSKW